MVFVHFYPFKIDELFETFNGFIIVASGLKGVDTTEQGVDTFC